MLNKIKHSVEAYRLDNPDTFAIAKSVAIFTGVAVLTGVAININSKIIEAKILSED